jgi:dipeptidyl aminopeptidase/acylaminoacyl peptidase
MTQADRLLRATIVELADEMPGPSGALASDAIARGRRLRRRHRLAVAGVAVLACVGITVPSAVVARQLNGSPPVATTTRTSNGLPGGWIVLGKGDRVYDRRGDGFVTVPHTGDDLVQPAPAGRRVLLNTPPDSLRFTDVDGSNPVRVATDGFVGNYQWSPTGDRVVTAISQKEPYRMGFAVINAQTGTTTEHWIDRPAYDCSECSFTFTRDGRQVVLPIADRSGGEGAERVTRLQLFDATTGAPTRALPIPAAPTGPFSWSPDGRYVIAEPDQLLHQQEIIDVATGTSRPFPYPDAVWATNDRLLATNATTVYTLTPKGTAVATITVNLPAGDAPITVGPPS